MKVKPTDFCFVDQCILTEGVRVGFLYREAPEPGGPEPDSGWSIRGEADPASAADLDTRSIAWVPLAEVLARDDSWRHLIDQPPGCAYERQGSTDEYLPVSDHGDEPGA